MTPKARKYVDWERQDNFSCIHENTLKTMEFLMPETLILHITVAIMGLSQTLTDSDMASNVWC